MNEDIKQAWVRVSAKLSDFIRLSIPDSAKNAVQKETQSDVILLQQAMIDSEMRPTDLNPPLPKDIPEIPKIPTE